MTQHTVLAPVALPTAGRYRIDPDASVARFATRHLFGLGHVHGAFAVLSGAIDVRDPVADSLVQVELDAESFTSGSPQRDAAVRGPRYLDAASHPTLTFAGEPADAGAISGLLTVRGVVVPVELRIEDLAVQDGTFSVRATARIDRYAFGITARRGLAARYLDVTVHARAVRE